MWYEYENEKLKCFNSSMTSSARAAGLQSAGLWNGQISPAHISPLIYCTNSTESLYFSRRLHDAMRRWVFVSQGVCVRVKERWFEYVGRAISSLAAVRWQSQPFISSCFSFKHALTTKVFDWTKWSDRTKLFLCKLLIILPVWNVWLVKWKALIAAG